MNLIRAQTRVAPMNGLTIPKMELNGAVLLANLLNETRRDFNLDPHSIIAFSDSKVVLAWINGDSDRWTKYVSKRTKEINGLVSHANWYYVNTHDNPADVASRGCSSEQILNDTKWFHGPEWALKAIEDWPINHTEFDTILEEKSIVHHCQIKSDPLYDVIIYRISSIEKLISTTALIFKYMAILKSRVDTKRKNPSLYKNIQLSLVDRRILKPLSVEERRHALRFWVLYVQHHEFGYEIKSLKKFNLNNNGRCKRNRFSDLNPILDEHNVLRVGGRLSNAHIPMEMKHPIILPYKHWFTNFVLLQAHTNTLHGGNSATLAYTRRRYWIVDGKNAVQHFIRNCVSCIREAGNRQQQLMGNLPEQRIVPASCFIKTGLDFAGYFLVKENELRKSRTLKIYVCVFVCMATKAVDFEVVHDLSTSSFLAAFKRFTARRGLPSDIYLDNATNHIGAKNELPQLLYASMEKQTVDIVNSLAKDDISFHFAPPRTPNFGGMYESTVRIMKRHLKRQVGNHTLTLEEFRHLMAEIGACMNTRPICPMSNSHNDTEFLTPAHFMIGRAMNIVPEPSLIDTNQWKLDRWQQVQRIFQQFWKLWSTDYLLDLQKRNKWKLRCRNMTTGDVVLLIDKNHPPCKWVKGIIEKTYPGKDGLIRVVDVRTAYSRYRRGINQLVYLFSE